MFRYVQCPPTDTNRLPMQKVPASCGFWTSKKQHYEKLVSGTVGGSHTKAGLSSLGVPGVPWHTHILACQLTLFQLGETYYAHLITTGTPGFSDLPTALKW